MLQPNLQPMTAMVSEKPAICRPLASALCAGSACVMEGCAMAPKSIQPMLRAQKLYLNPFTGHLFLWVDRRVSFSRSFARHHQRQPLVYTHLITKALTGLVFLAQAPRAGGVVENYVVNLDQCCEAQLCAFSHPALNGAEPPRARVLTNSNRWAPVHLKSKRRVHGAEFKTKVLSECRQPGASVVAIALNVSLLRKCLLGRGILRTGRMAPRAVARMASLTERRCVLCSSSRHSDAPSWGGDQHNVQPGPSWHAEAGHHRQQ